MISASLASDKEQSFYYIEFISYMPYSHDKIKNKGNVINHQQYQPVYIIIYA